MEQNSRYCREFFILNQPQLQFISWLHNPGGTYDSCR